MQFNPTGGLFWSQFLLPRCLFQLPLPGHGQGRLSVLDQPVTVSTAVQKMKAHLGLTHLRLALGQGKTLGKAICSSSA